MPSCPRAMLLNMHFFLVEDVQTPEIGNRHPNCPYGAEAYAQAASKETTEGVLPVPSAHRAHCINKVSWAVCHATEHSPRTQNGVTW